MIAAIPAWVAAVGGLGAFLVGIGAGVLLAWEETERGHRRGGFVSPGVSRERLGLEDGIRERRATVRKYAVASGRGPRPIADDAIEGPQEFRMHDSRIGGSDLVKFGLQHISPPVVPDPGLGWGPGFERR